ncbi:YCF1, partial [Symbiodinium sp. CCMP2456]
MTTTRTSLRWSTCQSRNKGASPFYRACRQCKTQQLFVPTCRAAQENLHRHRRVPPVQRPRDRACILMLLYLRDTTKQFHCINIYGLLLHYPELFLSNLTRALVIHLPYLKPVLNMPYKAQETVTMDDGTTWNEPPHVVPAHPTYRIGYAREYNAEADPWHDDGVIHDDELQPAGLSGMPAEAQTSSTQRTQPTRILATHNGPVGRAREWRRNSFVLDQRAVQPSPSDADTMEPEDDDVPPSSPQEGPEVCQGESSSSCPASTQTTPHTDASNNPAATRTSSANVYPPAGETSQLQSPGPDDDEDEDSEIDWESDTDDEQADTEHDPPTATPRGSKPQRRPAGHGSQRVKNKARKSDVKKLWEERGWPRKPAWLTWRGALAWLKRGEIPPAKPPRTTASAAARAELSSLLNSHHYSYDSAGNIVPQQPTPPQQPHATADNNPARDIHPPIDTRATKADSQARADHAARRDNNPYSPIEPKDLVIYIGEMTTDNLLTRRSLAEQTAATATSSVRGRTQFIPRKLTNSSHLQLRGDGVDKYPVVKLPRPPTQEPILADVDQGDLLFYQPPPRPDGSQPPEEVSGIEHPEGLSDLEAHAAIAVAQNQAPQWTATRNTEPMRSTVRSGTNTQDLSWLAGASPATLPPVFPLRQRSILTLRGVATGAWRGTVTDLRPWQIAKHPRRHGQEPTLVIYNTQSGAAPGSRHLPNGLCLTLLPVGPWVASTRVELGAIQTPQLWLVMVDADATTTASRASSSSNTSGVIPLTAGMSFWLQWSEDGREWRRRPRFENDIETLGGYSSIPVPEIPQPPPPPERHLPQTLSRLRFRSVGHQQQFSESRGDVISESETSWPSDDPPLPPPHHSPTDNSVLLQETLSQFQPKRPTPNRDRDDFVSLMQRGVPEVPPAPRAHDDPALHSTWTSPALSAQIVQLQQEMAQGGASVLQVLRLLRALLSDLLRQSHLQPREDVTELAYQACYYLDKLQTVDEQRRSSLGSEGEEGASRTGDAPDAAVPNNVAPTEIYFFMNNPLVEAEATLSHLVLHHNELPDRHLRK